MTSRGSVAIIIGVSFMLACAGCQQKEAERTEPQSGSTSIASDNSTGDVAQGKKLTDLQRVALNRIEAAGGIVDGNNVVPTMIDLATDRVSADDELVRSLAEFPQLRQLRLSAANTTPGEFKALQALTQLTELFLQGVPLTGEDLVGVLAAMPDLERLTLRAMSGAPDAVTAELVNHPHLKSLALIEMSGVSGSTLAALQELSSLRSLDIRNCGQLADDDFQSLVRLPGLTELKLGGPAVNDAVLAIVAQHPSLTALTVEDAQVSEQCLQLLADSGLASRLRSLALARCDSVSDETLIALGECSELSSLSLRNIFVTGSFIGSLHDASKERPPLKTLIVTNGFLSDDSVASLPDCFPQLVRLDLRGNAGITEASQPVFEKLDKLKELSVDKPE